jgi:hypothetical protein
MPRLGSVIVFRPILLLSGVSLAGSSFVCGCALPDSHLPQGFSSSYYRHLQGVAGQPSSGPSPVMAIPSMNSPQVESLPPAPGVE